MPMTKMFNFQRLKLTMEELLHHTPEWRANADRARTRDAKLGAEDDVLNENKSGFQNRAMTSSSFDDVSSKL